MASARQRGERWTGLYRDAQGKQKSAGTFPSETDALKAARHAEALAHPPETTLLLQRAEVRGKATIAGYAPKWLATARLEPTSRESYSALLKIIVTFLGSVCVADLDTARCRTFFRKLEAMRTKDGQPKYSSATIAHVRTVLRGICRAAVDDGTLATFPPESAWDIATVRHRSMQIATATQIDAIEAAVPEWFRLWVRTAYTTGMRYGELAGLGPEHIELFPDYAVIYAGRRVITEVSGKPVVKAYGKTRNAVRKIVVSRSLGERLLANARDGYVFRAVRGGYLSRANARRVFKPAAASVGLPGMRLHDVRHSALSAWVHAGKPLDAVMARAGHGDLKTLSRYTHDLSSPELWTGEAA